jgi:hypothetical protein
MKKTTETYVIIHRPYGDAHIIIFKCESTLNKFLNFLAKQGSGFSIASSVATCLGETKRKKKKTK